MRNAAPRWAPPTILCGIRRIPRSLQLRPILGDLSMSAEPMTLFARIADPVGVARLLRHLVPRTAFDGPDDAWRNAAVTLAAGTVTFTHDSDYYAEPNWSVQMNGMAGYFSRLPETQRKQIAIMLPTTFKFSLGLLLVPDIHDDNDPRLEVVYAVAALLDGVLFAPSALRDARGRVLYGAGGEAEENPNAVWPRVVAEVDLGEAASPRPTSMEEPVHRPNPARVMRRALALTAVTARAILEQGGVTLGFGSPKWNPLRWLRHILAGQADQHQKLLLWVQLVGFHQEFEPDEWEVLQRPPGRLKQKQQINSTWRLEGLGILAWALARFELPPHDQLVECHSLWRSLGMPNVAACKGLLADPTLRALPELQALRRRLLAINWRLTNFYVRPTAMDFIGVTETSFGNYDRTAWFSSQEVAQLPLVEGDLAIRGARLDRVSPDELSLARSIGHERHQAANWLCNGPEEYSATDVST
jgi:Domain of unknown function (DUF4272)